MSDLEMRLRVAKKIDALLVSDCPAMTDGKFDALEAARVIGLSFGLGLANAPNTDAAEAMVKAYELGVSEAIELRAALEQMGIKPE